MSGQVIGMARLELIKAERIHFTPALARDLSETHSHPFNELIHVVRGSYVVATGARTHHGGPGSVFVYPAGTTHQGFWSCAAGEPVTEFFLIQWRGPLPVPSPPLHAQLPAERARHCAAWILDTLAGADRGGRAIATHLLQALLLDLARQGGERDERDELVQIVDSLVDQTTDRVLHLDDLAQAAGMSRFHFARSFKAITGRSPMRYVRDRRLDAIRRDLIASDDRIATLAVRHGYASPEQLARLVRQRFGVSPRELRRRHRG